MYEFMNKAYLVLIGILIVVALGIGAFAFYRSSSNPVTQPNLGVPYQPSSPNTPRGPLPPSQAPGAGQTTETKLPNTIALNVTSPRDGQNFTTSTITLSGKTLPGADVAVNDTDLVADTAGNFQTTLTLDEGDNPIAVIASDQNGNTAEWDATVTYTPAQ